MEIFFQKDDNGNWAFNYDGKVDDRMHDYMEKHNHGVIDAALEEYRKDYEN